MNREETWNILSDDAKGYLTLMMPAHHSGHYRMELYDGIVHLKFERSEIKLDFTYNPKICEIYLREVCWLMRGSIGNF